MSSSTVIILDLDTINKNISRLRCLLENLPHHLPTDRYNFIDFPIDQDEIEDKGLVGALNHALEISLCPQGRIHGPFLLLGRGPGLVAIADLLSVFVAKHPNDAVLQKWIFDLIAAAEFTGAVVSLK
ncbi:hypothetical protein B0H21DRAFT_734461 [Amylocystis lapponica]|nr:hypothetical protein B0H21DRAFT_734461 [Amylocystis lapponica]